MLDQFLRRVEENAKSPVSGPVVVVCFGDSVTQGCMQSGVIDPQGVYHAVLKRLLERHFPKTTFSIINAGVGGESAAGGLSRLQRDVIAHHPDLLLLGFCLNDACGGLDKLGQYCSGIKNIIQKARKRTSADIIALTPNFMATQKNPCIAPEHEGFAEGIIGVQKSGVLHSYVEGLRETAAALGVPVADVYAQWQRLEARGQDTTAMLSNGLNHPDRTGHRLIASTIMRLIKQAAATPGVE